VGQLFEDIEKDPEIEIEESLLSSIFTSFGTLALVFYKRAKEGKLLEDKNFSDLDLNLASCRFIEVNHFVEQILSKINTALEDF
jgi:hypothetical protein